MEEEILGKARENGKSELERLVLEGEKEATELKEKYEERERELEKRFEEVKREIEREIFSKIFAKGDV